MSIKFIDAIKGISILFTILFLVSCSEDDLNSVNAEVIGNLNFVTKNAIYEVQTSSQDIDRVESSSNGQFLLGVYEEEDISTVRGSFVSQLVLPSDVYVESVADTVDKSDFSLSSVIDDVVLYIPYHATVQSSETDDDGETTYTYQLDSIFGVKDESTDFYKSFGLRVDELTTFLNPLDPNDPSKDNVFYSDDSYDVGANLKSEYEFTPSATHIATEIKRQNGVDEIAELTNNAPRIAIHLSETNFFQENFLDKLPRLGEDLPSDFQSQESFVRYFNGLYVNVTSSDGASIVTLPLSDAFVDMYYTNQYSDASDGSTVLVSKTMRFSLGGVKAVKYESLVREVQNTDKLYVQGTAGSLANIKLFGFNEDNPETVSSELEEIRKEANDSLWLVNEANILFYVEGDDKPNVDKLFMYKKVDDSSLNNLYNSQLLDYITAPSLSFVDGTLFQDGNGDYYYKFKVTDYITELLDSENTSNVDNLALKIFNVGDYPSVTTDTIVSTQNWNPRGVILHSAGSSDEDKKVKLLINYSFQKR